MTEQLIDRDALTDLLETMLQVPNLADSDIRDERVDELEQLLRRPLDASRFAESRRDLSAIINACLACSGGLRTLARLLQRHDPGETTSRLVALADEVVGSRELSSPDREKLCGSLTGISVGQIAAAVSQLVDAEDLGSLHVWRNIPAAVHILERLPLPDSGVPQLLTFTHRLAGLVDARRAADLHRWTDLVAGGLGVDAASLAELRRLDIPGRGEGSPPAADGSSADRGSLGTPPRPRRSDESGLIWGGVPLRNRNFSGRVALLARLAQALQTNSKASVLPQTLHGMGGVGKTQLVIEYVYRHLGDYDIVWWVASEQIASVLSSLAQLADRLGLPTTEDRQQTARSVLDALAGTDLSWLLVYDNADDPNTLDQFVPSSGGHVIITTRNQEWASLGQPLEVDVFEREESIELLQRRSEDERGAPRISTAQADVLADKLGDLPLALEQAVAWCLTTSMSTDEYIGLLDNHINDLLSEGKPANYPVTVAAFVTLATERLRASNPAAAQLFELFAYLGGEPVSMSLLHRGSAGELTEPLRATLRSSVPRNRTVRDLNRYGLAKVDAQQRVQVHRLVQRVLRDGLPPELAARTLRNAQLLLAEANPGDPDEHRDGQREDLGPHIDPAHLITATDPRARQVVLDHSRHLYLTGDYESSLGLASRAVEVWQKLTGDPHLGPDGESTLIAQAQIANAQRTLGFSEEAAARARDTYDRMRRSPRLGPDDESTLITGNQVGADLRIAGRYQDALAFDLDLVARHKRIFEPDSPYTLRAQGNLAVDHRMVGQFKDAYLLDLDVAARWEGARNPRALLAYINLARSCYGLGAYRRGLEVLDQWHNAIRDQLGPGNTEVITSGRTRGILLRKIGRLAEAAEVIRENEKLTAKRFRASHEFAVAATLSHANVLRDLGDLDAAATTIASALERYREHFGPWHPLTLAAEVNEAIICRARGQLTEARERDERSYTALSEVLSPEHPYTLCAGASLATDHALAGEHAAAVELSRHVLRLSEETSGGGHEARDGAQHPYVLMRAINLSHDLRSIGQVDEADTMFRTSFDELQQSLGAEHPEVVALQYGGRAEGDIEPPPT